MSSSQDNNIFKKTSFLAGNNSAFIEEYYSEYLKNPNKLPEGWNEMALRNIKSFNKTFDIEINRIQNKLSVKVFIENHIFLDTLITNGEKIDLKMISINN